MHSNAENYEPKNHSNTRRFRCAICQKKWPSTDMMIRCLLVHQNSKISLASDQIKLLKSMPENTEDDNLSAASNAECQPDAHSAMTSRSQIVSDLNKTQSSIEEINKILSSYKWSRCIESAKKCGSSSSGQLICGHNSANIMPEDSGIKKSESEFIHGLKESLWRQKDPKTNKFVCYVCGSNFNYFRSLLDCLEYHTDEIKNEADREIEEALKDLKELEEKFAGCDDESQLEDERQKIFHRKDKYTKRMKAAKNIEKCMNDIMDNPNWRRHHIAILNAEYEAYIQQQKNLEEEEMASGRKEPPHVPLKSLPPLRTRSTTVMLTKPELERLKKKADEEKKSNRNENNAGIRASKMLQAEPARDKLEKINNANNGEGKKKDEDEDEEKRREAEEEFIRKQKAVMQKLNRYRSKTNDEKVKLTEAEYLLLTDLENLGSKVDESIKTHCELVKKSRENT